MTNIWADGYTIVRDGQEIKLTSKELSDIRTAFDIANGRGSIEYVIESFEEDEDWEDDIAIAKEMLEDDNVCYAIWNDFMDEILCDSGEVECLIVTNEIEWFKKKKEMLNENINK